MNSKIDQNRRAFLKMHGLGNDFAIFDGRTVPLVLTPEQAAAIADRHTGIGCDQVIVLQPSDDADVFMEIWNNDGSRVEVCGNASRCVASLLADSGEVTIATDGGLLHCKPRGEAVTVDMGAPKLGWRDIPLAEEQDTLHLDFSHAGLAGPAAVNMGNPHVIFFVADADTVDLAKIGPEIESHPLFPERVNVSVAAVSGDHIQLRVWERGAGLTKACGTAACAALVAANRRGLAGRRAHIHLPGGPLTIEWNEAGHVLMTGPVAASYEGAIDLDALETVR